jgi:hypothetical protein
MAEHEQDRERVERQQPSQAEGTRDNEGGGSTPPRLRPSQAEGSEEEVEESLQNND